MFSAVSYGSLFSHIAPSSCGTRIDPLCGNALPLCCCFWKGPAQPPNAFLRAVQGEEAEEPRAEGRDPLAAPPRVRLAGCLLFVQPRGEAGGRLRFCFLSRVSKICPLLPDRAAGPRSGAAPRPAGPFLPKASPWRGGRGLPGL